MHLLSLFFAAVVLCETVDQRETKTYLVAIVPEGTITIDGKLGKEEWLSSSWTTDFSFPWQSKQRPLTEFCCVSDGKRLHFAFSCEDQNLVLPPLQAVGESVVAAGDRVELFFATDDSVKEYYCLELSPNEKVLDYRAQFYRKFDNSWDCPGLLVASTVSDDGYIVEGAISWQTLSEMVGAGVEQALLVGVFRAEFSNVVSGQATSHKPKEEWISWIRPDSETPDFHIPSAFGQFQFLPPNPESDSTRK